MLSTPSFDYREPAQKRALELIGGCVNCGFLLCSESHDFLTLYINERFTRHLGYEHAEFIGRFRSFIDCVYPEDRAYVQSTIAAALSAHDAYDLIYRVRHKDGGVLWIRENGQRVCAAEGEKALLCLLVDITADMATRQEMETQSKTDPLTKALNRAAFIEQMERLLGATPVSDRRHALIMIDVDHFKRINDTFGHALGDKVLEDVTGSLRATIRTGDLIGRLGGDEFMLCMKDINPIQTLFRRMEHIRALLNKPLSAEVEQSCSFGVAIFRQDGEDFATLYRHADSALYEAKRQGRNRIVFYAPGMDVGAHKPMDAGGEGVGGSST